MFDSTFWQASPVRAKSDAAELGIAELAKGNLAQADQYFALALKHDPKNPYALLGAGLVYQNTGQLVKARAMYEALLAIRPDDATRMVVWNNPTPRKVSEIASVNLALLDSGKVVSEMGSAPGAGEGAMAPTSMQPSMRAPSMPAGPSMARQQNDESQTALEPQLAAADSNMVSRFETLRLLLDQGLITPDEFKVRRKANVGALLPLTAPPPAAGLERPLPPSDQIAARLRAIGRALEMRAMTVTQHASERTMILDALLPAAPIRVANPAVPPRGLMEAADSVRRLEYLRGAGLITSDEYSKERSMIESGLQPEAPKGSAAAPGAGQTADGKPEQMAMTGPQPAVHLASFRSRASANRGWAQLRRAHQAVLGSLQPAIQQVDLGRGKGIFYRLMAGPLKSQAEAVSICTNLKRRRQYCDPTVMGGS
ncbi:MAG: SPOR domain-containing protein [Rhodospirillales bacterium]|nr:SPOR domain-containing protein [Rhodospirillales bacterium]